MLKHTGSLKQTLKEGGIHFLVVMIEAIVVQEEIISKMAPAEQKQLLNRTLSNYDAIVADDLYGFVNHASTGRIIVKLATALGDEVTRSMVSSSKTMQEFAATGTLTDQETFSQVISKAKIMAAK
jgi:hypothetical protein